MPLTKTEISDPPFHGIIYGHPGAGKTTFGVKLASHLTDKSIGLLDYENSSDAIRGTGLEDRVDVYKNIDEIKKWQNVKSAVSGKEHGAWIIDSATSMSDRLLMEIMKKSRNDKPLFDEWNELTYQMKEIFYACIDSGQHLILVSHQKLWRDEDDGRVKEIRPGMTPAAQEAAEKVFSEVLYLELKTGPKGSERTLYVESQGKILAKNRRSAWTENKYTEPNIKEMFNVS